MHETRYNQAIYAYFMLSWSGRLGWRFYGVRTQIKGRLGGRGNGGRLTSFFYVRKWRKMGMGLQMLLQIGITKYGNRNYTFGVFGGMIEGEGKG